LYDNNDESSNANGDIVLVDNNEENFFLLGENGEDNSNLEEESYVECDGEDGEESVKV
jgi:hypothetical protein